MNDLTGSCSPPINILGCDTFKCSNSVSSSQSRFWALYLFKEPLKPDFSKSLINFFKKSAFNHLSLFFLGEGIPSNKPELRLVSDFILSWKPSSEHQ